MARPPCPNFPRVGTYEDLVGRDKEHDCAGLGPHHICVRVDAVADLPTRFGRFKIIAFWNNRDGMGSLRCDCRDQLLAALEKVAALKHGVVLYMRQEGRGIGLVNKVRAYALQDQGLDTVDANLALGFRDDERDYEVAAHMLASLNVGSIRLMTNTPKKISELEKLGVEVTDRMPHVIPPNEFNRSYLETKATRSGHEITFEGKAHLPEQDDAPVIEGQG